jgi:hypothetical protein
VQATLILATAASQPLVRSFYADGAFAVEKVETFARFASSVLGLLAREAISLHRLAAADCSVCAGAKGLNVPGGSVAAMHAAARLAM